MRFKRDFEQKKALVNKRFTAAELKEYADLSKKPVLAKVHGYSSCSLSPAIDLSLLEIADEKENIIEAIDQCVSNIDNESLLFLLDMFQAKLTNDLAEGGSVNDIELSAGQVNEILGCAYTTFEIVKTLSEIMSCRERVKFFERRIELAKAGVSE